MFCGRQRMLLYVPVYVSADRATGAYHRYHYVGS